MTINDSMLVGLQDGPGEGGRSCTAWYVLPFPTCPEVGGKGSCNGTLPKSYDVVRQPEHPK